MLTVDLEPSTELRLAKRARQQGVSSSDLRAIADLKGVTRDVRQEVADYLDHRITPLDDPRALGKALRHGLSGRWIPDAGLPHRLRGQGGSPYR